jgi:hypothetical protein
MPRCGAISRDLPANQIGLSPPIVARQSQCSQTSVRSTLFAKVSAGLSWWNSSSSVSPFSAFLSVRSRSSRARWHRISSAENIRRTSDTNEEAPWRKPDAERWRWRNSSGFLPPHSQTDARRRNAGSRSFGSGPSWTMSLFGKRGLGPHSRIAGLLLFPLRPRGNFLSATTGFRFQWRRNRFACRNVLLWRFSGRPNWRSR